MQKDILLLSAFPPPEGGIATWTLSFLDYCQKKRVSIDTVDISMNGTRKSRAVNSKRNILDEIPRTFHIFSCVIRMLKNNSYSVFHINSSCSSFGIIRDYISVLMARKKRNKIVFHCHCNVPTQINSWLKRKIYKNILKKSDIVLVLNRQSKDFSDSLLKEKSVIVPNFIEIKSQEKKINDHVERVLYVGHIIRAKGIDTLLEVAKKKSDTRFILVGPIDDEYKGFSFPNNVVMKGRINHSVVINELYDADAFLFLSQSEGFSISLLEAMSCGLPIIATDVGANAEMIEDKGGIVLKNSSVDSVIEALDSIEDKNIREEISKWNQDKVINCYSTESVMNRLFDIYGFRGIVC